MYTLQRLAWLPSNIACYVDEIAAGVAGIYGPAAGEEQRRVIRDRMAEAVHHPTLLVLGAMDGNKALGMLWAVLRGSVSRIVLLHVLQRHAGDGVETALIREAFQRIRLYGADTIVCECIPFCPIDAGSVFESLGFARIERLLMVAPADAPGLVSSEPPVSEPCAAEDYEDAARVLVEAYADHPWRGLHEETWDALSAEIFVENTAGGAYGPCEPSYIRLCRRDAEPAGLIVGCRAAPDTGFVLHVAVRPGFRGRGIGAGLLRDVAGAFRADGLGRVALGVTTANPARRLYERIGFVGHRPLDAYLWQRGVAEEVRWG